MFARVIALLAAALFVSGAALAGPDGKAKPSKKAPVPKTVVVTVCPIMLSDAKSAAGGTSKFKNYKVNFCCGGCKPTFDALSAAEKQKKIAIALKKMKKS